MNRFRKLIGRFRSTEQHIERLTGDNASALEALYFLQERQGLQTGILRGAQFSGVDWTNATLATAKLENIRLPDAVLRYVYFYETHLENACLAGADFAHANLRSAYLQGADISRANFTLANLARARLDGANLQNACFEDANVWCASLGGADFTGATLQRANLFGAVMDETTILPDGTRWHAGVDMNRFV